jgi:AraC-like DNA-binding protein
VLQGRAFLKHDDLAQPAELNAGDLVMIFPGGKPHSLCDAVSTPTRPIWEIRKVGPGDDCHAFRYGGNGPATKLIYGGYLIEDELTHRLLSVLQTLIRIPAENGQPKRWVADTLQLLRHEQADDSSGFMAVNSVLARFVFVRVIRAFISEMPSGSESWLQAFLDPALGPVLGFIHLRPEAPWTVDSLAKAARMSRSTFAARFTEMVGRSPLQYVTLCRMQKAKDLLGNVHISIKEAASMVGYGSEAAFSTAFKRAAGISPYAYKKGGAAMRHGPAQSNVFAAGGVHA